MEMKHTVPVERNIYGANRLAEFTRTRYASRAIVLREGRILLSHTVKRDMWMTPGGGREAGETAEECCIREAEEETGFLVKPLSHPIIVNEFYKDHRYVTDYYNCEIVGEGHTHYTEAEVRVGLHTAWLPVEEALEIFSHYAEFEAVDEEKSGLYLREMTALYALLQLQAADALSSEENAV